jgi:hypothetical protein
VFNIVNSVLLAIGFVLFVLGACDDFAVFDLDANRPMRIIMNVALLAAVSALLYSIFAKPGGRAPTWCKREILAPLLATCAGVAAFVLVYHHWRISPITMQGLAITAICTINFNVR